MSALSVLTGPDLARLAATIRARHEDYAHVCACTIDILDADPELTPPQAPPMDVRERKWAAQKLLRPICPEDAVEDFTDEEWLGVHREIWRIRTGTQVVSDPVERFRHTAAQLHHTIRFARQSWNMKSAEDDIWSSIIEEENPPF